MPYFIDSEKDLSIYLAPKNGGTTLRLFLYYIFANIKIEVVNNSYYAGPSEMLDVLKSNGYSHSTFKRSVMKTKIAIKRDPLERFQSAYNDKIVREQFITPKNIEAFLGKYSASFTSFTGDNEGEKKILEFHFAPQTSHLGDDIQYFSHIYDVANVNSLLREQLEDIYKIKLPSYHARNIKFSDLKQKLIRLTNHEQTLVRDIYQRDFDNGYF